MDLRKLEESQKQWVESCESSLGFWRKSKEELLTLEKKLSSLADVLSHDVMVPLCSVAFVPGQIERTNEVLAFIGEGYFVKRSTKQACEILQRRIKRCEENIEGFEKDLKRRQEWQEKVMEMGKEKEEFVEIQEFVTEEEYQEGKEERRRRIREAKEKISLVKESETKEMKTEEDLLQRLEELELQEEAEDFLLMNDEMGEISESDTESSSSHPDEDDLPNPSQEIQPTDDTLELLSDTRLLEPSQVLPCAESRLTPEKTKKQERKSVSWNTNLEAVKLIPEAVRFSEPSIVTFSAHSAEKPQEEERSSTPENHGRIPVITSPGDIYNYFTKSPKPILKDATSESGSPRLKPILKSNQEEAAIRAEEISELADEILWNRTTLNTGVGDAVIARDSVPAMLQSSEGSSRPVSKFKQSRRGKRLW